MVSIIIATYNGSHVLKFAIKSVLNLSYQNWELIIVGDHCTDDTEEVISSFIDSRIHYFNLSKNSGQQAVPSNFGISKAKGKYIAFLNQDDLYLPWHLDYMLSEMRNSQADIVLTRFAMFNPFDTDLELEDMDIQSWGHSIHQKSFSPLHFHVASSWLINRSAVIKTGPWKIEKDLYTTPSQEWLFRAWKAKCKIAYANKISVIMIPTTYRSNFYLNRIDKEHKYVYEQIILSVKNTATLMSVLEYQENIKAQSPITIRKLYTKFSHFILMTYTQLTGNHPSVFNSFIHARAKGYIIKQYHSVTGKDEIQAKKLF